ncbi:MAG: hypothetical protein WCE21_02500 [Candidatus Babeliales bacterium]
MLLLITSAPILHAFENVVVDIEEEHKKIQKQEEEAKNKKLQQEEGSKQLTPLTTSPGSLKLVKEEHVTRQKEVDTLYNRIASQYAEELKNKTIDELINETLANEQKKQAPLQQKSAEVGSGNLSSIENAQRIIELEMLRNPSEKLLRVVNNLYKKKELGDAFLKRLLDTAREKNFTNEEDISRTINNVITQFELSNTPLGKIPEEAERYSRIIPTQFAKVAKKEMAKKEKKYNDLEKKYRSALVEYTIDELIKKDGESVSFTSNLPLDYNKYSRMFVKPYNITIRKEELEVLKNPAKYLDIVPKSYDRVMEKNERAKQGALRYARAQVNAFLKNTGSFSSDSFNPITANKPMTAGQIANLNKIANGELRADYTIIGYANMLLDPDTTLGVNPPKEKSRRNPMALPLEKSLLP